MTILLNYKFCELIPCIFTLMLIKQIYLWDSHAGTYKGNMCLSKEVQFSADVIFE